mmetsp:Transcript_27537/g.51005  ORF Transcript_27537/g.51005 Transcript_27537/m.51005 type:complete len:238 (+) Transcript_27537:1054-1767(+)
MHARQAVKKHVVAGDNRARRNPSRHAADINADRRGQDNILILIKGIKVVVVKTVFTHLKRTGGVKHDKTASPGLVDDLTTGHKRGRRPGSKGKTQSPKQSLHVHLHSNPPHLSTNRRGRRAGAFASANRAARRTKEALRFQFRIPIQEIHPTFMQMVRWELSPHIAQLFRARLARRLAQGQPRAMQCFGSFAQIARATRRHNILPTGHATAGARHHMVKGQIALGPTILTAKFIPQE